MVTQIDYTNTNVTIYLPVSMKRNENNSHTDNSNVVMSDTGAQPTWGRSSYEVWSTTGRHLLLAQSSSKKNDINRESQGGVGDHVNASVQMPQIPETE